MMVTWRHASSWRSEPIEQVEIALRADRDALLSCADELDRMGTPTDWTGEAAEAAKQRRAELCDDLEVLVAELSAARKAAIQAADALVGVEHAVAEARSFATAKGFTIADDGTVTAPPDEQPYESQHDADIVAANRRREVDDCAALVQAAIAKAADVDSDFSRLLSRVGSGDFGDGGATSLAAAAASGEGRGDLSLLEPPSTGTPSQNAGWWASLSPAEQERVLKEHPEWVGNRDGVPFSARDRANRSLLPRYREDLKKQQDDVMRRIMAAASRPKSEGVVLQLSRELAEINGKLASLDTVEQLAKKPDHHVLGLDVSRERAEAIIAQGDVDKARHVGVFTPGMTSTVQGMGGHDDDMRALRHQTADRLFEQDPQLNREAALKQTAMVTWLGYQAPQRETMVSYDTVVKPWVAEDGGRKLAEFYRGINSARADDPDLTALGHSYGSTTTGYALREQTGVDRVGYFGSPGITSGTEADFKVPKGQSFYGEARWDWVGDLGRFGPDPTGIEWVRKLRTTEVAPGESPTGEKLAGVTGHSAYLMEKSTSQYNLSQLVAGQPQGVLEQDIRGITDPNYGESDGE